VDSLSDVAVAEPKFDLPVLVSLTFNLIPPLLGEDFKIDGFELGIEEDIKFIAASLLIELSFISRDFSSDNLISDLGLELLGVLLFINISAPGPKLTDFLGSELEVSKEGKLFSFIVPASLGVETDNLGDEDPKLMISGWFIMFK
jgi:hypothetical protein